MLIKRSSKTRVPLFFIFFSGHFAFSGRFEIFTQSNKFQTTHRLESATSARVASFGAPACVLNWTYGATRSSADRPTLAPQPAAKGKKKASSRVCSDLRRTVFARRLRSAAPKDEHVQPAMPQICGEHIATTQIGKSAPWAKFVFI
jgi:hypothetical protein